MCKKGKKDSRKIALFLQIRHVIYNRFFELKRRKEKIRKTEKYNDNKKGDLIYMANENLHKAKEAKNDEFYTQLSDVAEELRHYKEHFKGKVVFCNCDDPSWSAFWRYFHLNFEHLGLKKLIATHYDKEKPTYKMEYEGGDDNDVEIGIKTPLEGNGDFRNLECIDLLKEADIVVTNPPFSMYRTYLAQLIEYKKDFIIWSNNNSITYKEVFPLIKENKIWLGYLANKTCIFGLPDNYAKWDEKITEKMNDGHKYGKVPAISVFTNLDIKKRHEKLILWKNYTPDNYTTYDNYDAINVDRVAEIPCDYCESWEVTEEEFKNFPANEWEITREGELDGKKSFFIIPAADTELRKLLHEHAAGYKEEIEKEISKKIQKNINNDRLPSGRQAAERQKGIVTDSSERQLLSLTDTIQNNLKSLDTNMTSTETEAPELSTDNLKLEAAENINELSSERYCNGATGVPITFLDKYNPEQFEIIKFRKGNDEKDLTYTKTKLESVQAASSKQQAASSKQQAASSKPLLRTSGYSSERYCNGIFGVPITFLDKYNSAQFEIIGATESEGKGFSNGLWFAESGIAQPLINKQRKYKRLFARKVL